jgi:nucleoside-diphosphate-sugar epimerase
MRVLITGGAGFVGSHLALKLLRSGHEMRVLDSLLPQVHGAGSRRPSYLDPAAELGSGEALTIGVLAGWLSTQTAIDRVDDMRAELARWGLAR